MVSPVWSPVNFHRGQPPFLFLFFLILLKPLLPDANEGGGQCEWFLATPRSDGVADGAECKQVVGNAPEDSERCSIFLWTVKKERISTMT